MAKITIAGKAIVVTSAFKLEDIKEIEKYRPEALILKGGEDGKEPIFRVCTSKTGNINQFGAEFDSETHDEDKKATITMIFRGCGEDDVKAAVMDTVGRYVLNLNKVEETLPAVLSEIKTEKETILSNIAVAQ